MARTTCPGAGIFEYFTIKQNEHSPCALLSANYSVRYTVYLRYTVYTVRYTVYHIQALGFDGICYLR